VIATASPSSSARSSGAAISAPAAHLSSLRRTASGVLPLDGAHTLEDILSASSEGRLAALFTDPIAALGLPVHESPGATVAAGAEIAAPLDLALEEGDAVAITRNGRLAAVYRFASGRLVPAVVHSGGGPA
jgi:tRNA pseudouridine55 synthase